MNNQYNEKIQSILLSNKHVVKISNTTIKFSKEIITRICEECHSVNDIIALFQSQGIEVNLIKRVVFKGLRARYVSKRREKVAVKRFDEFEIKELMENDKILRVTSSQISFHKEFMLEIAKVDNLSTAREVFIKSGIDINKIGNSRFEKTYYRWKIKYKKLGAGAFIDETRGRKSNKLVSSVVYDSLTAEEKVLYLEKQLKNSKEEVRFLKKHMPSQHQSKIKVKYLYYAIYNACADDGTLSYQTLLTSLNLNISGYYRHINRFDIHKEKHSNDSRIVADIIYLMKKFQYRLGYRRIKMMLDSFYLQFNLPLVNHKKILRLMRLYNINCVVRKKKPYKDIWSATVLDKVVANKLNRKFKVGSPKEILLTDITYLYCKFGKAYLSAVKDSVTNEILSYTVRSDMKINLSVDVLHQLKKLDLHPNVYIHSDQGVHYTSNIFREQLKYYSIGQSMSRRGNCLDNAPMESFFGHLKDELDYRNCNNLDDLKQIIKEYMIYYNQQRQQWTLKKMTPIQYRNHLSLNVA